MADKGRGISLLEGLLVLALVLVFMVLGVSRMAQISAPAERAAVQAMLGQLQTQVRLKHAKALIEGRMSDLAQWQGGNPFMLMPEQGMVQPDIMQELREALVPRAGQYCGELIRVDEAEQGCWYYLPAQQLVRYYTRWPEQVAAYQSYQLQLIRSANGRPRSLLIAPVGRE